MPTTGNQAGVETNATQLSYGVETAWGTPPAIQFQAIRYTAETLSGKKTRARPQEINGLREASAAVTTQESADGSINFALSYGTYDDLLSVMLGNDWQALQAINGVAADITMTSGTNTLSSGTAGKFTNIAQGQYIRLLGFTNAGNTGFFRVLTKVSALSLILTPLSGLATVTETPTGVNAKVRASSLSNGTSFKSLYLQQQYSASLFLRYPGSYVTAFTLSGGVGQFLSGSFSIAAQVENSSVTNASTGAVLAAPTGLVHDPVTNFVGVYWNDVAIAATVDSFSVSANNTGAAAEYGMGSATAVGMLAGMFELANASMKMYFKDFTYYANFKAETAGRLTIITKDAAGSAYVVVIENAVLMNPKIEAGGPNSAVMATFEIEGNPQATGGTVSLHRLAAT